MNREEAQFVLFRSVFGSVIEQNLGPGAVRKVFDNMPASAKEQMSRIQGLVEEKTTTRNTSSHDVASGLEALMEEDSYSSSSFSDSEIFSIQ